MLQQGVTGLDHTRSVIPVASARRLHHRGPPEGVNVAGARPKRWAEDAVLSPVRHAGPTVDIPDMSLTQYVFKDADAYGHRVALVSRL